MKWIKHVVLAIFVIVAGFFGLVVVSILGMFILVNVLNQTYRQTGPDDGRIREIVLKTQSKPRTSDRSTFPREWRLQVPRRHLSNESGANWFGKYKVDLRMMVNESTLEIKPYSGVYGPPNEFGWTHVHITFRNEAFPYGDISNGCLDIEDLDNLSNPNRIQDWFCGTSRCSYNISYEGWNITMFVDRQVYADKHKYCSFIRNSLNQWTTKIENPRY